MTGTFMRRLAALLAFAGQSITFPQRYKTFDEILAELTPSARPS